MTGELIFKNDNFRNKGSKIKKDGEKNISVFLLQTLNTSFDNVSDLFILHRVIMVNMSLGRNMTCCRYFVLNHLLPAMEKVGSLMDIRLWPYGKAETRDTETGRQENRIIRMSLTSR